MTDSLGPVDLLVVGGGMAGLTAAASAATLGARVVLVEQGEQVGGSAIYAGFAWTAPSPEVMAEVNPHGDSDLADLLLGGFGLLTDRHMRVRSGLGGLVPGLLAAGADVGGLYHRAYAGGLAPALVFGLKAASTARTR